MPLPPPPHVLAPAAYPYPHDRENDAWAEWEARLDATAHLRPLDPAVEAQLLADDALFRRRRAELPRR